MIVECVVHTIIGECSTRTIYYPVSTTTVNVYIDGMPWDVYGEWEVYGV